MKTQWNWALLILTLLGSIGLSPAWASTMPGSVAQVITATGTDRVDVTSRFHGRDILIYGALSHPGNIIVVLRSPDTSVAVTKKTQMGPLWVTGKKVTVSHFPGVLQILSSAPLAQILPQATLEKLHLVPQAVMTQAQLDPLPQHPKLWLQQVLESKKREGAFVLQENAVKIQDGRLFSVHLQLPSSIPLGRYTLNVYLVNHGQLLAQSADQIDVQQVGLEEWIAKYANEQPWLYGIALTLFLAFLGLGLGILMQRKS
ncbi:MAG: TIGR02186 family protein [Acidithiobacillus sp.]|nr:TIGR02186 family protein [Acidithiobacillus sp.]